MSHLLTMSSYGTLCLSRWLNNFCQKRGKRVILLILVLSALFVALRQGDRSLVTVQRQGNGWFFPGIKPPAKGANYEHSHQHDLPTTNRSSVVEVANATQNASSSAKPDEREKEGGNLLQKSNLAACPNLKDLPALVKNRKMNLTNSLPLEQLERLMCADHPARLREVSAEGMRWLPQSRSSNTSEKVTWPTSLGEVVCGDYQYLPGGHWRPASCQPIWKVAIVVPYRNRTFQLSIFLRYMIPFLQKQRLEFAIYIVNQANDRPFNRGLLLNIGFKEALKFAHWDCFIFHDVDHLPQSEENPYGCVDLPRHFISGADNRNYKVPYSTSFGGVTGFTTSQYQAINGFSNVYWGWCCEDDDLERRVRARKLRKTRYKGSVGYYKAITTNHHKSTANLPELEKLNRRALQQWASRSKRDGLNDLRYELRHLELASLYTNISVDIRNMASTTAS